MNAQINLHLSMLLFACFTLNASNPSTIKNSENSMVKDTREAINSLNKNVIDTDIGINQEVALYAISGNVFNDVNADGDNTSDEGLLNVTLRLYNDTNQNGVIDRGEPLLATTVTDSNGDYQFTEVTDIFVIAQVVRPADNYQFQYVNTTPVNVALISGTTVTNVNFGIQRTLVVSYNISGVVWDDANGNQILETNEQKLTGISVRLYEDVNGNGVIEAGDTVLNTVSTSGMGDYEFTYVQFSNVIVAPVLPSNTTYTTSGIRAISSINTDVVNVDFGIDVAANLFEITGVVFDDDNENGISDVGEGFLDGLSVEVYADTDSSGTLNSSFDNLVASVQTSNGGNYSISNVPFGQIFIVIVIPAANPPLESWTPTYDPDSGTANPDGVYPTIITNDIADANFGVNHVVLNSTSRDANTADTMYTNANTAEDVSERLRLYPNPTVKQIAINAEEFAGDVTVEIYNDQGHKVITSAVNSSGNEIKVDVQRLALGMYYAKFQSRTKVASKKFIKK